MKILLSSDSYYPHPGGVSEYMHFLGKYLEDLDNEVVILAPHYSEPYHDDLKTRRIGKCFFFNGNKATITFTFHHKLPILVRNFVRNERFDIIHTNGPIGWNLPYWALHYSRAVNVATFHTAFTGVNLYKFAKVFFKRMYHKKLHGVIYPSKTASLTTFPHFPIPYRIIPNGVDTERFHPEVKPLEKFPADRPKILFLGRLDPRKGLDKLLKAYPLIKKRIEDALLIVVGAGPLMEQYKEMVPRRLRESVYFEGRVTGEMVPRYYATCDIYVSPATGGEVFGIVLTEAMATAKPVAASNIAGYNEVIEDGMNGLLFDQNNPYDIADKVIRILEDSRLRNRLSTNARNFAVKLSWRNIAARVMAYYESLLQRQRGSSIYGHKKEVR